MPQVTFLGATVRQAAVQASFNLGSPSQLTVSLVEDPTNGDSFAPGDVLRPVYFSWGALTFNGLLQRHQKTGDTQGYPTYEAIVSDPREILDGTQVVLGGYSGGIGLTPNVISPFGWWEAQGFGLSGADERGMPWSRILTALDAICTQPTLSTYGGPLNLRGSTYALDLSQMPATPTSYRVGSSLSVSLLELIATVCEDAGYDFLVDLVGTTIRIRTVSRKNSPPIGTILALADARRGIDLVRYSTGVEGRNEPTSAFLFGGEVRTLHRTTSIASFWGHDASGAPILGSSSRVDLSDDRFRVILEGGVKTTDTILILQDFATDGNSGCTWNEITAPFEIWTQTEVIGVDELLDAPGGLQGRGRTTFRCTRGKYGTTPTAYANNRLCFLNWGSALCDRMTLNATPVEDILGGTTYPCTTFEMRLAKAGHNPWSTYIQHYRPDIARLTGMLPPLWNKKGAMRALPQGLVNDRPADARGMAEAAIQADAQARTYRLYEFVRGYADEYMGRKFAIPLPQIQYRQDPETLQVKTSYEIDDGGYLPEGSNPLGLSSLNEDVFRTPDGRLRAFAAYTSVLGADFSLVSPDNTVLQDNAFYTAVEVDPNIIYVPGPAAVVTVPGPLFDQASDSTGDVTIVRAVLQMQTSQAQLILKAGAWGNIGVRISPAHRTPASVAVALKSNTETYGPWYRSGAPGKARVEQDGSLVPWLYGGFELMNAAGTARVAEASTSALAVDSGSIELAGAPTVSIGDALQAGGAVVTDMQIQYGTQGLTTQYRFQTFTPRFGVFSRGNQDRMKRLALTQTQLRKAIRGVARGKLLASAQAAAGARVRKEFQGDAPKGMKRQSPHDIVVAQTFIDDLADNKVRTGVSSLTFEEAVGAVNADDAATYQRTAAMSWNGLLRPFSTATNSAMASYSGPLTGFSGGLSRDGLDPWKAANDVEIYLSGDDYDGMDAFRWGGEPGNARPIGLRGPLVVAGWGVDTEGAPVPGDGAGSYTAGYLNHPETWPAGPVDLLWDKRRGVWTCHDVMKGVTQADIPASLAGSGSVQVYRNDSATDWSVSAFNWSATSVPSGTRCHLLLNALDGRWYVHSLAAPAATAGSGGYRYEFHHPEFIVVSGDPTTVRAAWGGVPPAIATAGSSGTLDYFARSDHTHAHPVFASGDLHPEYALPNGPTYSLLYRNASSEKEWSRAPQVSGIFLGGVGLGSLGFVQLWTPQGSGHRLYSNPDTDRNWGLVLPDNVPQSGHVLGVVQVGSDQIYTRWVPQPSGGSAYRYQFHQPEFVVVSGDPTTVAANWASSTQDIALVGAAGTSELFARGDHVHAHPVFAGGDLHPEYKLPSGLPYSVLWLSSSGTREWAQTPIIEGVTVGGSGVGSGAGFVSVRNVAGSGHKHMADAPDRLWTVYWPNNVPSSGNVLTVVSATGDVLRTAWQSGSQSSQPALRETYVGVGNASNELSGSAALRLVDATLIASGTLDGGFFAHVHGETWNATGGRFYGGGARGILAPSGSPEHGDLLARFGAKKRSVGLWVNTGYLDFFATSGGNGRTVLGNVVTGTDTDRLSIDGDTGRVRVHILGSGVVYSDQDGTLYHAAFGSNVSVSGGVLNFNGGSVTSVDAAGPAAGFTVTGGPITTAGTFTFSLANDLAAVEGLAGSGIAVRASGDLWETRGILGTASRVTVQHGQGIAGNPTIDIASDYAGQNTITTLGTVTTGTWSGTAIGSTKGGTGQTTWALGDLLYASGVDVLGKLSGNTTTTRKFLRQTGDGSGSAAPAWDTLQTGDLPAFTGLTATDIALDDEIPVYDTDATANRKILVSRLLGLAERTVAEGRLTLESGVSVSTSDQSAKTNLYYAPHDGTRIGLYDGTRWRLYTFSQVTLASPTLTSALPYDVFLYDSSGTLTLELTAWTNSTTRATALTTQDGVLVKSGATTRRYLGTILASATNQMSDTKAFRGVWNCYNRRHRPFAKDCSGSGYTYSTAAFRAANNDTGNKLTYICGLLEDSVVVNNSVYLLTTTSASLACNGIGVNSTTVDGSTQQFGPHNFASGFSGSAFLGFPRLGVNEFTALECGAGAGTQTWYPQAGKCLGGFAPC